MTPLASEPCKLDSSNGHREGHLKGWVDSEAKPTVEPFATRMKTPVRSSAGRAPFQPARLNAKRRSRVRVPSNGSPSPGGVKNGFPFQAGSSMGEQGALNPEVAGSTPARPTNYLVTKGRHCESIAPNRHSTRASTTALMIFQSSGVLGLVPSMAIRR